MDREDEYQRTTVKASINITDIKTRGPVYLWDKSIGNLLTGWAVSGVKVA